MTITRTLQKLTIVICSGGYYRRMIFNPMAEARARELVRQYGYRPEDICLIRLEEHTYRQELDVLDVLDWLDSRHTFYHMNIEMLYDIVRQHIPNLDRIYGVKAFIAAYNKLIHQGIDTFLTPHPKTAPPLPAKRQPPNAEPPDPLKRCAR